MKHTLSGLYAITNEQLMSQKNFLRMAEAALDSGVSILQYRDKSQDTLKQQQQAQALGDLCRQYQATFIINDDLNLAKQVDADGVHIGLSDTPFDTAREALGDKKIIGVSCYNQPALAQQAINAGANYIALGSFYGSNIKPDAAKASPHIISEIKRQTSTPICCIGGITTTNIQPLLLAGADMVAVISDIFSSPLSQDIKSQCQAFSRAFKD